VDASAADNKLGRRTGVYGQEADGEKKDQLDPAGAAQDHRRLMKNLEGRWRKKCGRAP